MTEMPVITADELAELQERARKLARDKSYLQLIINLMNKVSASQGLDSMIETLLNNILTVIGGTNIILYYLIDDEMHYADLMGKHQILEQIDDDLVNKTFQFRAPIETEHDFCDTQLMSPEFTKAYTWVFPLLVGRDLIGVIKLENLHLGMRELYAEIPTFFTFVSSLLKNEIYNHTRLKQSYDQLSEINDELEIRVAERTAALRVANEKLQEDLCERQRAQEALRKYAEELHDLYNHAPCGYHSLDKDGLYIRINDTELKWLGYERDEIVGKKLFSDVVTPQSVQCFREYYPRFKQHGWVKDLEFEMVRKDGTILPVLLSATAITDADGNYLMSRSTIYDITDRKRTEESEHLLSSIVESTDDAILSKDLHENILSWNKGAERIYGYSAEEIIGKNIRVLIPAEREQEVNEIMASIQRGERIEHFTTERIRKDGKRIFVSLTISPIRDSAGDIVRASVISRDITEQVQLAEQIKSQQVNQEELIQQRTAELLERSRELQDNQLALMNIVDDLNQKTDELESANAKLMELDRLKSMFIASMSHELRTPLNSIIGFSSILRDEWLGPVNSEQKENLTTIFRSGKHLLNLINDVIDVSKIEAGKVDVRLEEFDLHELISEAVQYLDKEIKEKGLELDLKLHHQTICSDRRRLLQCVINLLSNAYKFTEQGGITISTSGREAMEGSQTKAPVCIEISDTGIGIAEEDIPKLFKPFVRLDSPIKIIVPGTGLGLYLTRKLVGEVLKGDIICASQIDVGSTFTIRIPERIDEKSTGH